jgi:hypothetical protein
VRVRSIANAQGPFYASRLLSEPQCTLPVPKPSYEVASAVAPLLGRILHQACPPTVTAKFLAKATKSNFSAILPHFGCQRRERMRNSPRVDGLQARPWEACVPATFLVRLHHGSHYLVVVDAAIVGTYEGNGACRLERRALGRFMAWTRARSVRCRSPRFIARGTRGHRGDVPNPLAGVRERIASWAKTQ